MNANVLTPVMALCRGKPEQLVAGLDRGRHWLMLCVLTIVIGGGLYGFSIGLWRSPLQALYTGIKFPLLILLVTAANGLLNGMLAQVLGLGISFRRSALSVLTSFAIASAILGSLSPVTLFVLYNTPPLDSEQAVFAHNFNLLSLVGLLAFAGVAGNVRLYRVLLRMSPRRATARSILLAWLVGNLFLGAQLSWNMRPFVGSPKLPVEFFRSEAFEGSFYESVYHTARRLLTHP
jgi:hypothetical protein